MKKYNNLLLEDYNNFHPTKHKIKSSRPKKNQFIDDDNKQLKKRKDVYFCATQIKSIYC